jgi:hypothetical protein
MYPLRVLDKILVPVAVVKELGLLQVALAGPAL